MRRLLFVCILTLQIVVFSACSSVDSDAEKAANAVIKSYELTAKGKLIEAEKYYNEYKKIDQKYHKTEKYTRFREAYNKYISTLNNR